MSCTIGQRIEVTTLRGRFEGIASGITDEGVLQLTEDDGTVRTIYAGDIKFYRNTNIHLTRTYIFKCENIRSFIFLEL